MTTIEIQTIEGGRLEWVAVYSDSDQSRAIRWGDTLLSGFNNRFGTHAPMKPNLRVLDKPLIAGGKVIGAWQQEGYEGVS